ncbi:MAG: cupin [Paucibacter sp.]|nr:cupin [Roseateles sp.]
MNDGTIQSPRSPIDPCVIDAESVPWIPLPACGDEVMVKYYKLDPVGGEMVLQLRAPSGAIVPELQHSGSLLTYTIEGRWKLAGARWIAGPGSVVCAPAGSRHSPACVVGEECVITMHIVAGTVVMYDRNGSVLAVENCQTALARYAAYCERSGILPRDLATPC